jgi:2-polyprenyl-3-methyl-5-hydroxy-6-metoxy-1,4-benzoquinol methylase
MRPGTDWVFPLQGLRGMGQTMATAPQLVDNVEQFKAKQREMWALGNFGDIATFTTYAAGHLVRFAGIRTGQKVLDVGTGTGVVAVTAARQGAHVTGLDLTPELIEQAKASAHVGGVQVQWDVGDAERLPYADHSFDVVVSQFGHMFAPRPEVATAEMLRVLKPAGRIAFATWPPEQLIGRSFALGAKFVPPPPGAVPTGLWGDPNVVRERLGAGVDDLLFERGVIGWPALSPMHYRSVQEAKAGPFVRAVQALKSQPERLAAYRKEFDALVAPYLVDNVVRLEYLLTRATKRAGA